MKKILVVGIVLLFLGSSIPTLAQPTESFRPLSRILYVGGSGPGNYSKIQDAITEALEGDEVFVYNHSSPYYENIRLTKNINLIGEDKETTVINGRGKSDVVCIRRDQIILSGFTLTNCSSYDSYTDSAIVLRDSNFCIIQNCIIKDNSNGVLILGGFYNQLINNRIENNTVNGTLLKNTNYSVIKGNIFSKELFGVILNDSSYSKIFFNDFFNTNETFQFSRPDSYIYSNFWYNNYYNRPHKVLKIIHGLRTIRYPVDGDVLYITLLALNFDIRPAHYPHSQSNITDLDIQTMNDFIRDWVQ